MKRVRGFCADVECLKLWRINCVFSNWLTIKKLLYQGGTIKVDFLGNNGLILRLPRIQDKGFGISVVVNLNSCFKTAFGLYSRKTWLDM
jgi:hypothetical protein